MARTYQDELRELLQGWEPPAGPNGFEGMIAVAIAYVSGIAVRLARSGSQFGRDGLSTPGGFVIAFEAKRYVSRPTLQELTTKAALAAFDLGEETEIWACALSTDLGDLADPLSTILDREGIALLVLDWPTGGLSPLAVLLAAARTQVVTWAERLGRSADAKALDQLLAKIEQEAGYDNALALLRQELTDVTAGLGALARGNHEWSAKVLANPDDARAVLGQRIVPAQPGAGLVAREHATRQLVDAVLPATTGMTAVLGGEGCGKSWLVADWALNAPDRPILLLAAGPLHTTLDSQASGEEMLSRLLSRQHGGALGRWLARIRRWRRRPSEAIRFALVLDGLNERASGKKWATIIDALVPLVADLGGVVIATCRPGYWRDNIATRLRCPARAVEIGDFEEEELRAFFLKHKLRLDDFPADLHGFLANPRIAALAVKVLPRLPASTKLSRDRLLLEYWRSRIEDRGDLVAHNDDEFRDLLAVHARQFRSTRQTAFGRAQLAALSGQVVFGGRSYEDDLAELSENRFFTPTRTGYEIKGEALATALGLLLHGELAAEGCADHGQALAFINAALEPVADFDETANAVAACIVLALSERALNQVTIVALIVAWFAIQNRNEDAERSIDTSIRNDPAAFLDALEVMDGDQDERALIQALHGARSDPAVWTEIAPRIPRWLGSWKPVAERFGLDQRAIDQQAERTVRIEERIRQFNAVERALFDRTTHVQEEENGLARAAVQLAMSMPLAGFAEGIVGFSFVGALKGHRALHPLFCWMLRSNEADFDATHSAVRELIAPLCDEAADDTAKQAAAIALESMGRRNDAEEACALWPRQPGRQWRSVENICDVDPLDPDSGAPTNLSAAVGRARSINAVDMWNHMSSTAVDHGLEEITAALARFDMPVLASVYRAAVLTAPQRRELPLRQLSWRLPELSALFEGGDVQVLKRAIADVIEDGRGVSPDDRKWVLSMMVEALLPHLPLKDRMTLMASLPDRTPLYNGLARRPVNTDGATVEAVLECADAEGPGARSRALHMVSASNLPMTARSRELVANWLADDNGTVASLAANIVRLAGDDELDELVLRSGALQRPAASEYREANRSAAFASVVVRQGRADLAATVPLTELGWVAGRIGGQTLADYRRAIDGALAQLLRPLATPIPNDLKMRVEADEEGRRRLFNFDVREVESADKFAAFEAALNDQDGRRWNEQRRLGSVELRKFIHSVTLEGAGALVNANWLHGLDEVIADDVDHARGWAESIIAAPLRGCDQTQAIGGSIAAGLAPHDPELAVRLFRRILDAEAIVDILIGPAKIPLRLRALFRGPANLPLDELRAEQFMHARNDGEIEALSAAATAYGSDDGLDVIVADLLSSPSPAHQATAIMISGFRRQTESAKAVLTTDFGPGFLGAASAAARDAARRSCWSEHWRDQALLADDPVDFWRASYLASRCVDRRGILERLNLREGSPAWHHYAAWTAQLDKGAERRTKKRSELLYGQKKPWR